MSGTKVCKYQKISLYKNRNKTYAEQLLRHVFTKQPVVQCHVKQLIGGLECHCIDVLGLITNNTSYFQLQVSATTVLTSRLMMLVHRHGNPLQTL